jgi:hypothetical protein
MLKCIIGGVALIAAPLAAQTTTQSGAPTTPPTQPGSKDDPGTPRAPLPTDRGYDKPQTRTEAINAPNRDDVARANAMSSGAAATAASTARTEAEIQYDADMAAWLAALEARGEVIAADRSVYLANQRAYADAMAAWRRQTAACKSGATAACKLPTPNPADYR